MTAPLAPCAVTAANGHYEFSAIQPGGYRPTAMADGFAPGQTEQPVLHLMAGADLTDVEIRLKRGGARVTGAVRDARGGALTSAHVRMIRLFEPAMTLQVGVDAEGRFECWVPPGPLTLEARADGYAPTRLNWIAPSDGVQLQLTTAARIHGQVMAKNGRGVAGIEVRAAPSDNPFSPLAPMALSDGRGEFRLDGLEAGSYALIASGSGFRSPEPRVVEAALAEQVQDIQLEVERVAQLSGRVLIDTDGAPCQRGFVMLGPSRSAASDGPPVPSLLSMIEPDGRVRFDAPAGRYHALVRCSDHVFDQGPRAVDVSETDIGGLTWQVTPGLGLRVNVVDAAASPLGNIPFYLRSPPPQAGGRSPVMPLRTDATGRFEVPRVLEPGDYTVMPSPPYTGDPVAVALRDGMGTVDATLALEGNSVIEVTVTAPEDQPVDGLSVYAATVEGDGEAGPSSRFPAAPRGLGHYHIAPLKAGTYTIMLDGGIDPRLPAEHGPPYIVELGAGQTAELTIPWHRK